MVQAKDNETVLCWRCGGKSRCKREYLAVREPGSKVRFWTAGPCVCEEQRARGGQIHEPRRAS